MRIERLVLNNFRNYAKLELVINNNINIFIGSNAQGKTNILEALYLSAVGSSHRAAEDVELINFNAEYANIELTFMRRNMENNIVFRFAKKQKKEIILNGLVVKPKEAIGLFNAILFSPEDLWLVKGSPAVRRKFIDNEISQASPLYYKQLIEYNRIVLQRNNLLKKIREGQISSSLLDTWDEQLVNSALLVYNKRQDSLKKLNMLANLMHRKISASKENLSIQYMLNGYAENNDCNSINYKKWLSDTLIQIRQDDIRKGSTNIGPHRDDLIFNVNEHNLKIYGSQGQQRTGILALKLAEIEYIKAETGEYPVLLLDDVMSELDSDRRNQLLSFIKDRIQTFITATDKSFFPDNMSGRYYRVRAGTVMG